jgi:nucleoside-diphosphate-sugar epimerase
MKILVLGSSGQIGDPLCKYLNEQGHIVERFDIVDGDEYDLRIHKNKLLETKIKNADFVYFLAFDVGGSRYLAKYQNTYEFLHNNIQIMHNVFEYLKMYKKKFIFASSQMSSMSWSPYGVAKAVGERYTRSLNGLVVKFWNVYGPEKDLSKAHVITDFILKAKNNKTIDMLSDGLEVRQFLHARDCSRCLLALNEKYDIIDKQKEFHITSFEWVKIIDVAKIIASKFENVKIIPSPCKDNLQKDIRNEADKYVLEFWKPEILLEDGIEDIIGCLEK